MTSPPVRRSRDRDGSCVLCARERRLTFHHLIPVTLHKNRWFQRNVDRQDMHRGIMVCRDCHDAIHRFIPHKELGRSYNTVDALRGHPELSRFVTWVSRQQGRCRVARPTNR